MFGLVTWIASADAFRISGRSTEPRMARIAWAASRNRRAWGGHRCFDRESTVARAKNRTPKGRSGVVKSGGRAVRLCFVVLLWTLFSASAVVAAPDWQDLDAEQQGSLQSLSGDWNSMPELRRENILRGLTRWNSLNTEGKKKASERLQRWSQLSTEDKVNLRQQFDRFQNLDEPKKEKLRSLYRDFKQLDKKKQKMLRENFDNRVRKKPENADSAFGDGSDFQSSDKGDKNKAGEQSSREKKKDRPSGGDKKSGNRSSKDEGGKK